MNNILSNSGLIHIRDEILGHLDFDTLAVCCQVSKDWNIWVEDFVRYTLIKILDTFWDDKNFFRKVPGQSVFGWNEAVQNYAQTASVKDLKKVHESLKEFWRKDWDYWIPECYEEKVLAFPLRCKLMSVKLMQRLCNKIFHFYRMKMKGGEISQFFKGGNIETIKFLIKSSRELGIDLNLKHFHNACVDDDRELVKMMIESSKEYNIDLNARDNYGKTAFMRACISGRTEVIKIIINSSNKFDIDLNARHMNYINEEIDTERRIGDRKTGFIYACINGYLEAVKWMIEKREEFGIDIRRKDLKHRTALDYVNSYVASACVINGGLHEVKKLLENEYRKPTHKYNLRSRIRHSKDDESQPVAKKFKVK